MLKTLLPYMKKYKWSTIFAPLSIIAEVLLEITIPVLMSRIVDNGIPNKDLAYIVKIGMLMVIMAIAGMCAGALSSRLAAKASMGFASELRSGLFKSVQRFSFSNVDRFSSASLVTRLTTDVTNAQNAFQMCIRMLVRAPVMLVGATIMAFSINSSLVSVFLITIPILAATLFIITKMAHPRFIAMLKKYDGLNSTVQENLISIRVVKSFVRSAYEKDKFKNANDGLMNASLRAEKVVIFNMPIMQLSVYACIIAILWFGGNMIAAGNMETGELISFINYVTQILMSLMTICMVFTNIVISRASLSRIIEVLNEQPDIKDSAKEDIPVNDGSIEFKNVTFSYYSTAEEVNLKNINVKIHSGETIGIIGGTGSAKSTLVQLIPRLYDADEGEVLVGGRNVRDYKLKTLRSSVAMVLQKNVLFSGTIKENLRWGNAQATDEEIEAACKAACAHDFITSFPNGYETELGQGGVNVSGGQKQRLCIARALLCKPKILILDDSTSAVDTATDARIRDALKTALKGATKLIIAQRITSVCEADRIIVMDDGRISDIGTHEELLKRNEIYREVYTSQQKGVE
ncbi:MAG TPA: ABC transporter ATP-binding protein/permease [Firmicutes bacterium]|nr:ABC transporter ATP-binding protein/permease [Bacillota bacterium]